MPGHDSTLKRAFIDITIPSLSVTAFFLLYIFRNIDDNRLTSWKWTFANVDIIWFTAVLLLGMTISYLLSKISFDKSKSPCLLFIISFGISTIFWKEPEVIIDSSRYFTQAKYLKVYGMEYFLTEWGESILAWTDLPLISFFYGLIFKYIGEARIYIQIFNTSLFSLSVVLTYLIGKELWDRNTGFYAGAFLLGIPYIFSQVPLMLVDVPAMFFLTLSVFTFIRGIERGGIWMPASSLAIFCAVLSKYSVWLMLSILAIILIVYLIKGATLGNIKPEIFFTNRVSWITRRQIMSRSIFIGLGAGILLSIILVYKYDVVSGQISFLQEYQRPGLKRWTESFTSTFLYQIHPFITIAALCGVIEAVRKKDLKFIIISWLFLIVVFLQIKRSRYIMITFPMLSLMAAYGLQIIKTAEIKRYIALCIVISSVIIAVFAYLPFLKSMSPANFADAGKFLDNTEAERVKVFSIPSKKTIVNPAVSVPLLDLSTRKKIIYYDRNFSLPVEKIRESPLRFTWEYKTPDYYSDINDITEKKTAIVIISNGKLESLPELLKKKLKGYETVISFNKQSRIFRYHPVVTVYLTEKNI